MSVFKNRDNKKKWNREGDIEYIRTIKREIRKVAPDWVGEGPIPVETNWFRDEEYGNNIYRLNDPFTLAEFRSRIKDV